jgi:tungstate transport system substrate-binding protein
MEATLSLADERQAYTLSNRATYMTHTLAGSELVILIQGDPTLSNFYNVIAVSPDKGTHIKSEMSHLLINWLTSIPTQQKINLFGRAEFGQALFTPISLPWQDTHPTEESSVDS